MRRVAMSVLVLLGGCVSTSTLVTDRENDLSAAGFQVRPVNSPQRQAMFDRLPPNKVVQRIRDDKVAYLYADAVVCHCLYAGDQAAFGRFQQAQTARRVASDNLEAAQLNADSNWDWSPWGYGGFGPGFGGGFIQ